MAKKKDDRVENEDVMRKLMDKPTISEVLKKLCSRLDSIENRLNLIESQISNLESKSDRTIPNNIGGEYWYEWTDNNSTHTTPAVGNTVTLSGDTEVVNNCSVSGSTASVYTYDASALQS